MSLSRLSSRLSRTLFSPHRTYASLNVVRRHSQQQYYYIASPCNHLHTVIESQNKVVPWRMSTSFQRFEFSSSASPKHTEKESGENASVKDSKIQEDESTHEKEDSGPDNDEELTMEDMVKLLTEKEELLKAKQKEIENMKDKVLRTYAEMENVKDRTRREAENVKKFGIQNFAKGLLDVADNLSRASTVVKDSFAKLDTSSDTAGAGAVPLLKTLLEGVEMTEKQLAEVLKKSGVERFDPTNEPFDPNRHNAVFQVPDGSKPPGTVSVVLKVGYMLHDRVLRPAEVGVTKVVEDEE